MAGIYLQHDNLSFTSGGGGACRGVYKPERSDRRVVGGGLTLKVVLAKLMFVRYFWSILLAMNF